MKSALERAAKNASKFFLHLSERLKQFLVAAHFWLWFRLATWRSRDGPARPPQEACPRSC